MLEFTKDEMVTILDIFKGLRFPPGQSKAMAIAEGIIEKCNRKIENEKLTKGE